MWNATMPVGRSCGRVSGAAAELQHALSGLLDTALPLRNTFSAREASVPLPRCATINCVGCAAIGWQSEPATVMELVTAINRTSKPCSRQSRSGRRVLHGKHQHCARCGASAPMLEVSVLSPATGSCRTWLQCCGSRLGISAGAGDAPVSPSGTGGAASLRCVGGEQSKRPASLIIILENFQRQKQ